MSYIINKTDGSVLTEVVEGTIDQIATDITLVGKNSTSYGEFLNENFIKILENFANTTQPNNPIEGQLWYDTTEGRLKVYDGSGFKVSGGTIVSPVQPSSFAQGDIWIDSSRQQLYFNDGNANLLAGPIYTAQQGISGFQVQTVVDTNNIGRTIVLLYVGQVLVGIWSTVAFTLLNDIPGYTGASVSVGFNPAYSEIKINANAVQADSLASSDGAKVAASFMQVDPAAGYTLSNGTIRAQNNIPLILGSSQNTEFKYESNTLEINSNIPNQNLAIRNKNGVELKTSMYVNAQLDFVGIYTDAPTATLDVAGDTRIRGNLTVEGNTTTINTTNISIEDLLVELGKVDVPTNSTANGGGISLAAGEDGNKTITWLSSNESWNFSENVNLDTGKIYQIGNNEVLSQTALGTTITSANGLTSIGTLNQLQVDNININGETISFVNISVADGNIVLVPKGAGVVNVSSKKITNLANPVDPNDAVNLSTLEQTARTVPSGLTVNYAPFLAAFPGDPELAIASTVLSKVFPAAEHEDNTYVRVFCPDVSSLGQIKEFRLTGGVWVFIGNL
jgi:hypothetical protein